MRAVAVASNTNALEIAYKIKELEESLNPKPTPQGGIKQVKRSKAQEELLSDNLRRYKREKLDGNNTDAQVPLGILYLLAFLLLPTVVGTFAIIGYMQYRFYKKYADCRPVDLRYKDYFDY